MKLIRYIHPVGQGAFYTEQFFDDNSNRIATVVYDCGTSTNKAGIEREIRDTFKLGEEIDYLFISHFHNDHINGIEELKKQTHIKSVVIPLYNDFDRLMYLATIATEEERSFNKLAKLILNPEDYFNEKTNFNGQRGKRQEDEITEVIQIKPLGANTVSSSNGNQEIRESGTIITNSLYEDSSQRSYKWEYVPFNIYHEEKKELFQKECQIRQLKINDINQFIKIKANRDELKKIYKKLFGGKSINESSMMVYSGLNDVDPEGNHCHNACLYTGDATFNAQLLNQMQQFWDTKIKNITMFQIPHHASKMSFDLGIIEILKQTQPYLVLFTSCGNNNTYGHPSPYVITQCNLFLTNHAKAQKPHAQSIDIITCQRVKIITESKDSMLVLQYEINNNNNTDYYETNKII